MQSAGGQKSPKSSDVIRGYPLANSPVKWDGKVLRVEEEGTYFLSKIFLSFSLCDYTQYAEQESDEKLYSQMGVPFFPRVYFLGRL